MHRLQVLHGGVSFFSTQVRMEQDPAVGTQVRHVRGPRGKGQPTACATACPTGATKFGDRDTLIAEAKSRIANNRMQYVDHIYGLNEVGGTSVPLLSSVPFEEFGYKPNLPLEPPPVLTYRALSHVPDVVAVGTVLLGRHLLDYESTRAGGRC